MITENDVVLVCACLHDTCQATFTMGDVSAALKRTMVLQSKDNSELVAKLITEWDRSLFK